MLEKVFKNQILTSLIPVDVSVLQTRKKVAIFSGVDHKSYYHLVFKVNQKSRFVLKNAQEILELEQKMVLHVRHNYKYKHIVFNAPLCSKAALILAQNGWRILSDIV